MADPYCMRCNGTGKAVSYEVGSGGAIDVFDCACSDATTLPPDPMLARIRELEAELDAAVRLADALATQLQASAHADRDALWAIGDRERALSVLNGAEGHFTSVEEAAFIAVHDRKSLRAALVASEEKRRVAEEKLANYRDTIDTLVKQRAERIELANAISADNSHLAGVRHALSVFCRAFDLGGVSCGKLCEMLGHGISDLHSVGVQAVANAIVDAADDAARATSAEALAASLRAKLDGLRAVVAKMREAHAEERRLCEVVQTGTGLDLGDPADMAAACNAYERALSAEVGAEADAIAALIDLFPATEEP